MIERVSEFWLSVLAALFVVWRRTEGRRFWARIVTLIGSGIAGVAWGPEVSEWAGTPPMLTVAVVTAAGPLALEMMHKILGDPDHIMALIKAWRGK